MRPIRSNEGKIEINNFCPTDKLIVIVQDRAIAGYHFVENETIEMDQLLQGQEMTEQRISVYPMAFSQELKQSLCRNVAEQIKQGEEGGQFGTNIDIRTNMDVPLNLSRQPFGSFEIYANGVTMGKMRSSGASVFRGDQCISR